MINDLLRKDSNYYARRQVNSRTFPSERIHNFLPTTLKPISVCEGIFSKHYKSYSKLIEIFTSYVYLHHVKDYFVCRGRILDLELNYMCFVHYTKNVLDIHQRKIPQFLNVYIAKELLQDKAVMKYFQEVLEADFNCIILSKEDLNDLLRKQKPISPDLIPLTYE